MQKIVEEHEIRITCDGRVKSRELTRTVAYHGIYERDSEKLKKKLEKEGFECGWGGSFSVGFTTGFESEGFKVVPGHFVSSEGNKEVNEIIENYFDK